MPTYHYRSSDCGHSFDFFQKFADDPLVSCPECEGTIRRIPQPVGVVFKGSGWYINDSRNAKSSTSSAKPDTSEKSGESDTSVSKQPTEKKAAAAVSES